MGVPQLVAYLKQEGFDHVRQRDLDLDLFDWTLSGAALERVVGLLREQRRSMPRSAPWWKRWLVRWAASPMLERLGRRALRDREHLQDLRAATALDRFFPEGEEARYRRILNGVLKLYAALFYPHLAYPKFRDRREERAYKKLHLRLGNYLFETLDLGNRALRDFYERELVPELQSEDYDAIGISVSVQRQLDPALLLADTLRAAGVRAELVLGGSFVSNTYHSGWLDDGIVRQVDYVVLYEGEEAFAGLLGCIERGEDPSDVSNLVYLRGTERVETRRDFLRDIERLPTPDYDDLSLERYLDRPLRLSIMGNRGCYWSKCAFCVQSSTLGTNRMRLRSAEQQLADMKTLVEKHGTRTFFFTDETLELNEAERLAHLILEEGLDVNWGSMVRLEDRLTEDYLRLVRSAGFYLMLFGLESINQRVLDSVDKGIDVEVVWRVLRDCKRNGIKVNLFMILGIPGETEAEMRENVEFMLENGDLYDTLQITTFDLFKRAPMELRPASYGIAEMQVVGGHLQAAYSEIEFETTDGLTREEVAAWKRRVDKETRLFGRDLWSGSGYRLFHPDRARPAERALESAPADAPEAPPVLATPEAT